MLIALTRRPSPAIRDCLLTYLERLPIDFDVALRQHRAFEELLERLGVHVVPLPPGDGMADCVFIQDTAVPLDEAIVVCNMKSPSRQREIEGVLSPFERWKPVHRLAPPATLEGGDVFRIGRTLYVGLSTRTNRLGAARLRDIAGPLGYEVRTVAVTGCLHLTTGCTHIGAGAILANPAWIQVSALDDHQIVHADPDEPFAANTLLIGDTIVMPACFPRTRTILERRGRRVESIDISEFQKAEAGLTCMSLVLDSAAAPAQPPIVRPAAPAARRSAAH